MIMSRITRRATAAAAAAAVITAVALALSAPSAPAAGSGMPGLITPGTLVVGMNLQFKPEMYVQNGQPAGYDVDLLRDLAAHAHVKLKIMNLDFTGLVPGLETDKFDLVSTGLAYTAARAQVVSFTRPYVPYAQVVGIPPREAKKVTSIAALNKPDDEITALLGSTAELEAEKSFPRAHIDALANQDSDFELVSTGRANAIVVESYLLAQYIRANPGELAEAKIPPLDVQYGSWAARHGNTALVDYLNTFICRADRDGELAKLYERDFAVSSFPGVPGC